MTLKLLVLFFTPLLAGMLIFLVPRGRNTNYKMLLVFAGSISLRLPLFIFYLSFIANPGVSS